MDTQLQRRLVSLAGAAALAAAVAGLVSGTRPPEPRELSDGREAQGDAPVAASYSELREQQRGPNGGLYAQSFSALRAQLPGLTDPVEQSEEEREVALEARRARRAYAGAPPTVPHPIQERNAGACLSCHGEGAKVAGLRAPAMSHQPYTMCVQCHATTRETRSDLPEFASEAGRSNSFEGLGEPGRGRTAWEGAPPTIPHAIFMRERCSSCHGPSGAQGLKTPHPYQQSCTQCHAPAGEFDQGRPPPFTPPAAP